MFLFPVYRKEANKQVSFWPDCKPEGPLFSSEFVCGSVCQSLCVSVCVSLTGTSTLQR